MFFVLYIGLYYLRFNYPSILLPFENDDELPEWMLNQLITGRFYYMFWYRNIHMCITLTWSGNFRTPVILVNYKWMADWWKSNLSVCIKNYINQILIFNGSLKPWMKGWNESTDPPIAIITTGIKMNVNINFAHTNFTCVHVVIKIVILMTNEKNHMHKIKIFKKSQMKCSIKCICFYFEFS